MGWWWRKFSQCVGVGVGGKFNIYMDKGKHNLADYYTKHHSGVHQQLVRPIHLHV